MKTSLAHARVGLAAWIPLAPEVSLLLRPRATRSASWKGRVELLRRTALIGSFMRTSLAHA